MAQNEQAGGNNLDDFFAKKDKSKKKTKSGKFTVDDILQAKPESDKKSKSSKKKDKDSSRTDKVPHVKTEEDDAEWNEIEDDPEKDYSGLRVQNLQITNKNDDDRQDGSSQRNEDGDDGESRETASGPWKPVPQAAVPSPPVIPSPRPSEPEVSKEAPKSTGKYVPPQMRRAQGDQPAAAQPMRLSRAKKTAPDVHSQEDFPTLGSVAEPCESGTFEKIRSGARQIDDPSQQRAKLTLDNKYNALDSEDS